jgi:hypothetical protein
MTRHEYAEALRRRQTRTRIWRDVIAPGGLVSYSQWQRMVHDTPDDVLIMSYHHCPCCGEHECESEELDRAIAESATPEEVWAHTARARQDAAGAGTGDAL